MKHYLLCTLALLALLATARADDEKKKSEPPAPDSFKSLTAEFSKAQRALANEFRAEKEVEEREKIRERYMQLPGEFANRYLEFALANADDPTAFDALVWVVANDPEGTVAEKAIPVIVAKHLDDPTIPRVCEQLSRSNSPAAVVMLQAVMESSKNVDAQAYATYGLAKRLAASSEDNSERAEALLARVVKDYAKVGGGSLAKAAERELFEIQHLSVGCEAPDIKGEDIDGVEFSLVDYRGKIVVLDFWGNW